MDYIHPYDLASFQDLYLAFLQNHTDAKQRRTSNPRLKIRFIRVPKMGHGTIIYY